MAARNSSTNYSAGIVSERLLSSSSKAATSGYTGGEVRPLDLDLDLSLSSSESVCSGESGSGDFRRCYCEEPDLWDKMGAGSGFLPVVKYC